MSKNPKKDREDWYWPLGDLEYQHEIRDFFSGEAEMLGIITILWNRQELKLRAIYKRLISSRRPDYAMAIWDRQPTHQARRDLLALALHTTKLTKRQAGIIAYVVDKTKVLADRRNELIHAEYVVHARTDKLHAKVSSPRSNKPPKHQKVTEKDLQQIVDDLEHLIMATEAAWLAFSTKLEKKFSAALKKLAEEHGPLPENRQNDSDLPSLRQIHGAEY
tara:strand:+ start:1298 stop:1954 length:657 start_codon:yes stop_codon:yes gene_type:complete